MGNWVTFAGNAVGPLWVRRTNVRPCPSFANNACLSVRYDNRQNWAEPSELGLATGHCRPISPPAPAGAVGRHATTVFRTP